MFRFKYQYACLHICTKPEERPEATECADAILCAMNGAGPRGPGGGSPRTSSYLRSAMQAASAAAASAAAATGAAGLAGSGAGYDGAGAGYGGGDAGTAARRPVGPTAASSSEEEDNTDPEADPMAANRSAAAQKSASTDTLQWDTPKKKKSGVWQFFLQGAEQSNRQQAKCRLDGCLKPVVKAQSTSNLTQHMHARHRNYPPYLELKGQEATAAAAIGVPAVAKSPARVRGGVAKSPGREGGGEGGGGGGMTNFMKKKDDSTARVQARLILGFIVGGYESLDVVEEEQYRAMMRGFTNKPNMRIPSRQAMQNLLTYTAMAAKAELSGMVAGELVSLSCDCWTSGNQVPMMAVTAHWVDKDWVLKSACLSVLELAGSQNSVSLAEALNGTLVGYNISQENVTAVTTNTAAYQKTAILDHTGMEWLPCIGNALELVMDILTKHFAEVLDKVNTIVALVHQSQAALVKLREAQKSSGLNETTLPASCPTRWWSTIVTVQAFVKNRTAVKMLCVWARDNEKEKLPTLTGYEWMLLADILVIASQWRQYQTRLEGEKYLTVSTLDIVVDGGFSVVSEASTNPALCKEIREVAALMEKEMYKMLHPEDEVRPARAGIQVNNPLKVARMATVLDPRTKNAAWASPETIEEFFYGPVEKELEVMMKAEEAAAEEENVSNDGVEPEAPDDAEFSLSRLIQSATNRRQSALEEGDDGAPAAKVPRVDRAAREAVMNEWAMYKSSDVTIEEVEHDGGPLAWWGRSEPLFPHLASLARKYLAVQASSTATERLFSVSGLANTKRRNSLGDDATADIIFLHEGMKHKLW